MKYKDQILKLILDGDDDDMINWILAQPLLEQPDIFRELKAIAQEAALENGDDINDLVKGFDQFDGKIDNYEDTILDEKLAEAQLQIALDEQEKAMMAIAEATEGTRQYVIECIVTNAENAAAMRELANQMMSLEKDAGTYLEENWKEIL